MIYLLPGQNLPISDQAVGESDVMSGAQEALLELCSGHSNASSGYSKPLIYNLKPLSDSLRQELMSVADASTAGLYQQ